MVAFTAKNKVYIFMISLNVIDILDFSYYVLFAPQTYMCTCGTMGVNSGFVKQAGTQRACLGRAELAGKF